ncbi:hypothetical protein NA57DRAFT_52572 [Rhizodiscina lignyota]|uniref:NmrA-like domain-containing protein n=1 Tax=Rhizodiscina lignyota TaxID=1504668 RepID=A0A9P4IRP4_9PEZI|nr:hypothetical protein NA57DRAFT_52572 [Rhizodiscina lignyota]
MEQDTHIRKQASGNLGPHILNALHHAGFAVSVLTRPESSASFPAYASKIATDYSLSSLKSAFQNQDAVVSCVGVAGVSSQIAMIDAADEAGVKRFMPSEWGWAKDRPMLDELKQRLAEKEKVFDYLVEKCNASKTMSWSAIAAGPFLDWALVKVPALGFVIPAHKARIIGSGDEPVTASIGADIGKAAAGTLIHGDKSRNRFLKIFSVETTQNKILAVLERSSGTEWKVDRIGIDKLLEDKKQKLEEKNFQGAFVDVLAQQLFEDGKGRGRHVERSESENELLGIPEKDTEAVVELLLK